MLNAKIVRVLASSVHVGLGMQRAMSRCYSSMGGLMGDQRGLNEQ